MLLFQEIPILLSSSKFNQKNLNLKLFLHVFIQINKRIFAFSYAHWHVLEWNIAGETVALCNPTTCIYTLDNGIVCLRYPSKWSFLPGPHHFGECFCHHREPGHRRMCLKGHSIIGRVFYEVNLYGHGKPILTVITWTVHIMIKNSMLIYYVKLCISNFVKYRDSKYRTLLTPPIFLG